MEHARSSRFTTDIIVTLNVSAIFALPFATVGSASWPQRIYCQKASLF